MEDALPMGTKMKIIIITGGEERSGRKPNRSASAVLYGGGWYTRRRETVVVVWCVPGRLSIARTMPGRSFVRSCLASSVVVIKHWS